MRHRGRLFPATRTLAGHAVAILAALSLGNSCATNPATGQRQVMLISENQEIEMGRQADREVEGAYGLYPDPRVQQYVADMGRRLAEDSERPNLPWTFRVVDDPTVNAFALPGGFIYVTRGLMSHVSSEAELASVVGHEIGHVTARHSAAQMSKQQLAMIGLGVGMVARPDLARFGDLAQTGLGLMFLKFGRDAERQADDLGLKYMGREGYDPREAAEVFSLLDRVSQSAGGGEGRLPSWLSTHPAPEDRAQRIRTAITTQNLAGTRVGHAEYLRLLDGMTFGENPREGFFVQEEFYHPDLRFQMRFPRGWRGQNQRQAVGAVSPNEDAIVVMTLAPGRSAEQAADTFLRQQNLRPAGAQRTRINGLHAVSALFEAASEQAILAGRVTFLEHGDKVYRLLAYTPRERFRSYDRVFADALESFGELTDRRYLDVQPRRLEIVTPSRAITPAALAAEHRSPVSAEVLALINGIGPGETLPAGQPAKVVIGGRLPGEDRPGAEPIRRRRRS